MKTAQEAYTISKSIHVAKARPEIMKEIDEAVAKGKSSVAIYGTINNEFGDKEFLEELGYQVSATYFSSAFGVGCVISWGDSNVRL